MPIILIRGLPGSGKTTIARKMVDVGDADTYYEADMWFDALGRYDVKFIGHAHEWCRIMAAAHHAYGSRVIISNTFTQKWEMAPYFEIDPDARVIECAGKFQNVHDVPDWKIERMAERWEAM